MPNHDELKRFHQKSILDAAKKLFLQSGIERTTMDDIAAEAQYSKSTLYVYFKSKDEIFQHLVYEFNTVVRDLLEEAISTSDSVEACFMSFCHTTARMQRESPFYFETAINNVKKGKDETEKFPILQQTIDVNVQIHEMVRTFIEEGIKKGQIRPDVEPYTTAFTLWSSIYGIISMAYRKEEYLHRFYKIDTETYLDKAFRTVLGSVLISPVSHG